MFMWKISNNMDRLRAQHGNLFLWYHVEINTAQRQARWREVILEINGWAILLTAWVLTPTNLSVIICFPSLWTIFWCANEAAKPFPHNVPKLQAQKSQSVGKKTRWGGVRWVEQGRAGGWVQLQYDKINKALFEVNTKAVFFPLEAVYDDRNTIKIEPSPAKHNRFNKAQQTNNITHQYTVYRTDMNSYNPKLLGAIPGAAAVIW